MVIPHVKLQQVDRISAQFLANQICVFENMLRRKYILIAISGRSRPLIIFRRNLGRRIQALALVVRDHLAEQAVALAIPVRPRTVEKIATQVDSQLQ